MAEYFPFGVQDYLLGGLLLGFGTGLIFLCTGIRAGASSFFTTTISWVSSRSYFQRSEFVATRDWRFVFSFGLIIGGVLYTFALNEQQAFVTTVQPIRLFLGGLVVGFGTRLSRGCTSGHGICGLSSGSPASLLSVILFLGVAICTAHIVQWTGVTP